MKNKQITIDSQIERSEEFEKYYSKFNETNKAIDEFTSKHNGQCIRNQSLIKQFVFQILIESSQTSKLLVSILSCFRNNLVTVIVTFLLKQLWTCIDKLGTNKILDEIQNINMSGQQNAIYDFRSEEKSIVCRIVGNQEIMSEFVERKLRKSLSKIVNLVDKAVKEVYQIQNNDNNGNRDVRQKIGQLVYAMQFHRKQRTNSSIEITTSKLQQYLKQKQEQYHKKLHHFNKQSQKYEKQLKQKYKASPNIFRSIKQRKITMDNNWNNQDGSKSFVSKHLVQFIVNNQFSINVGSNQQISKVKEQMKLLSNDKNSKYESINNDNINNGASLLLKELDRTKIQNSSEEQQSQNKVVDGYLIKKLPREINDKNFKIEKNILASIRNEKCHSINNFYCIEKTSLAQIPFLYSDFHNEKLNYKVDSVRKLFRILITTAEGLLFMKWNGISHRDLKSDNILISSDQTVKFIDFGSACHSLLIHRLRDQPVVGIIRPETLFTNSEYNLRYSLLPKQLKDRINRQFYEFHPFFDVYAFGRILQKYLVNQTIVAKIGSQIGQPLQFLSDICQQSNPDDRPDPLNLYCFLREVYNLLKKQFHETAK